MLPLHKFLQKDKPRVDTKIKKYYAHFKEFICCSELPDFKIEYTDSRIDKSITYKAQVLLYRKPIILKYNIASLDEISEDFKATLVHEFTHIYDYYQQSKKHNDDFIKRNLYLYTEYHAVQIEILFCYHIVDKITNYAEIMKADVFKWLEFPSIKNKIYANMAIQYLSNKNIDSFQLLKTTYMYAAGASAILGQLMERELKTMKFIEPYEEQMQEVVKLLSSIKYDEIPSRDLLQQIGTLNVQMKFPIANIV